MLEALRPLPVGWQVVAVFQRQSAQLRLYRRVVRILSRAHHAVLQVAKRTKVGCETA